jgi:phosphoserine phosphatase RsbU/P
MPKILAIDDENTIIDNIKFVLELSDYEVITASNGEDGLALFNTFANEIDVVITDMKMPRLSGIDVLKEIRKVIPEMSVIILTGHGDMENAILAMKDGAYEYLRKPVNADELTIAVGNAMDKKNLMLDNARMQRTLLEQNEYLNGLQDSAQKILLNLIPKKLPDIKGYNFSSEYKSCETVGGDMYDVCDLGDFICFYVFDVSSHGILASVISVLLKSFIQNMQYNYTQGLIRKSFDQIVSDLNLDLFTNTAQNVFATLFIGFIEKSSNKLYYVSAGHISQMIFNGKDMTTLSSTGTVLGVFEAAPYSYSEIQLKHGDKILLFTDGIIEAVRQNVSFGYEGLLKVVECCADEPLTSLTKNILNIVYNYTYGELLDDVTVLAIEVT